jgi:hypothetical protein
LPLSATMIGRLALEELIATVAKRGLVQQVLDE